jgi:hypothetical protein
MFWVFLLTTAMIVALLKLGAASVTVNVLSIALIAAGLVIVILLVLLFHLARRKAPEVQPPSLLM